MCRTCLLFLCSLLLAACGGGAAVEAELPTLAPVAQVPAAPAATATSSLPPTRDLTQLTSTPAPTAVPPTRPPTATPLPVNPGLNLTSPDPGAQIVLGSDIVVRGLAQVAEGQRIRASLVSANGRLLAEGDGVVSNVGWEAGLSVPQFVSGAATVRAQVLDADGAELAADQAPVTLALDAAGSERYLALNRPTPGTTAVAGFFLNFDGRSLRPTGNSLVISLWVNDCQEEVAKFRLNAGTGGNWRGSLGVPGNLAGPACAVAYFGAPGEPDWREAVVPVEIVAADDPEAGGIQLTGVPGQATAGGELVLSGAAFNAASVLVGVVMEDGRIIADVSGVPDPFGIWEVSIPLPFDVSGVAQVRATAVDASGAALAVTDTLVTILPAP